MRALKEQTIWLIGASTGIGEALSLELAKRGAKVAVTARRQALLDTLVSKIEGKRGTAKAFAGDVLDLAAMKEIATQISSSIGAIDIVIANAGSHIETWPEKSFSSREYLDLMQLNYGGLLHCIEAALPEMLARKTGQIVGVASLAGYRGLPKAAAYSASKAAMINFLDSIRFHLRKVGITVTTVNPGFVKTPLTDKNDFYMPFLVSAEKAAIIIADGIALKQREIAFPFPFNWILKLGRILPYPLYAKLVDQM